MLGSMQIAPMSDHRSPGGDRPGTWFWRRRPITWIEDLSDGVLGTGLNAVQMSRASVKGSLAFLVHDGILFSSGLLDGKVSLTGPLSVRDFTIGVLLSLKGASRQWLREVETGTVGVFCPGDEHDAIYAGRSLYLTATLTEERLLSAAEQTGIILDPRTLRATGIHPRPMSAAFLDFLRRHVLAAHRGRAPEPARDLLGAFVAHLGRPPRVIPGLPTNRGYERIVSRARTWIHAHLEHSITIDEIAAAAFSSRRTLHRAFAVVLEESPQDYTLRLRLHRIRADLASEAEAARTIAIISNRWGIGELGRMSGRYRAMFGELPSETIIRARQGLGDRASAA